MSYTEKWNFFIIIIVILASVMIFNFRMKQENNEPIENRVANRYCGQIKNKLGDNWVKCFDETKRDVVNRFSDFESCQEKSVGSQQFWTENEWFDCYQQREQARSDWE